MVKKNDKDGAQETIDKLTAKVVELQEAIAAQDGAIERLRELVAAADKVAITGAALIGEKNAEIARLREGNAIVETDEQRRDRAYGKV